MSTTSFQLTDHRGKTKLMRDGSPFTYSSRELARRGKHVFEAQKDCTTVFRIEQVLTVTITADASKFFEAMNKAARA